MIVAVARAADWEPVAIPYQELQEDLALPASVAEAQYLLAALRRKYMAEAIRWR